MPKDSVASADAALLSAARAFASLRMEMEAARQSQATPASTLPAHLPKKPQSPSKQQVALSAETMVDGQRKPIYYSRLVLLKLSESPLCKCPDGLKPLNEWYGEYEQPPSPAKQQNSRNNHQSSQHPDGPSSPTKDSFSASNNNSNLGRGPPPARSPFANFGRFGSDDGGGLNAGERGKGGGRRIGDREREREGPPHLSGRDEGKRRMGEGLTRGEGRDREEEGERQWQTQGGRRPIDRYVPDYGDNNRNRGGRDRDRDRDRVDRDRRPNGDEWRRVEGRGQGGNRRDWDNRHDRDRERGDRKWDHPKDHDRPQKSRQWDRDRRDGRDDGALEDAGDAPAWADYQPGACEAPSGGERRRGGPKDNWDIGEGKWEGAGGGADAIQAWKAEMKALEAKKRGEVPPEEAPPAAKEDSKSMEQTAADAAVKADPSIIVVNGAAIESAKPIEAAPSPFASIGSPPPAVPSTGSTAPVRGSRFAKFFDSNRDNVKPPETSGGDQAGVSASGGGLGGLLGLGSPPTDTKMARTPSADPENMARVLSMLQMSSKVPGINTPPPAQENGLESPTDHQVVRPQPSSQGMQYNHAERTERTEPAPSFNGAMQPPPGLSPPGLGPPQFDQPSHTRGPSLDQIMLSQRQGQIETSNSLGTYSQSQAPPPQQVPQREGSKMHFMQNRQPQQSQPPPPPPQTQPAPASAFMSPPPASMPMSLPPQTSMPTFSSGPPPPPGLALPGSRGSIDLHALQHVLPSPQMGGFGMPPMGRPFPGASPTMGMQPTFGPIPGLPPPGLHSSNDSRNGIPPQMPRSPLPPGAGGQAPPFPGPPLPGLSFGAPPPGPFFSQGPPRPGMGPFMAGPPPPLPPMGVGFEGQGPPPPQAQQIDLLALLNGRKA